MTKNWLSLAALAAVLPACTTLAPGNDTADAGPRDAGGETMDAGSSDVDAETDCRDPGGFGGLGCYRCPPMTRDELLNACTGSTCVPFDRARVPAFGDAGLPPLPPPMDAGAPAIDAGGGMVDAGDVDAARPDAGPGPPACASLTNVVYATGSTAATLFLGKVAQALENEPAAITVVYKSSGSCVGVSSLLNPSSNMMRGTAIYWDPNPGVDPTSAAAQLSCQLDSAGVLADLGFSDVFAESCQDLPGGLDPSLRDFHGPIQTMNFVVPQNSLQHAISSEAAYLVYGFGGSMYPVAPWTDATHILQRNASSGTQSMIAAAIGVPRDRWFGVMNAGSGNVRDALFAAGSAGTTTADATIGILSSDFADGLRDRLRILALQHYGQSCGFYPDSTETARDKRNVRDGHYPIFGPLHMFTRADAITRLATNPNVQRIVNVITGVEVLTSVDTISLYAGRGLIPQCAMRVTRSADGGEVSPFVPDRSCGCYFEELATSLLPPPGCTQCDRTDECTSGQECVRFAGQTRGYCE